jgi:cytochrome c556
MKNPVRHTGKAVAVAAILTVLACTASAADKDKSKKPVLSAKEAVEQRRAAFNLVGKTFKPFGGILKGEVDYKSVDVPALAKRLVSLNEFFPGTFHEDSNLGEPQSKARAEIWKDKEDFKKRLKDFRANTENLLAVVEREKGPTAAFKEAAQKVAQDCKGCHDNYKVK